MIGNGYKYISFYLTSFLLYFVTGKNSYTSRMHNVLSKPATMYGSETWILRPQGGRRIEIYQMRFRRAVAGVTLRDRIKSEDVRKRLQTGNVVEDVKQYQRKWLEHVERIFPEHLPWQVYFYTPTGRRDLGRPRTRWNQQFQ
jgi:hypothetical protein